MGKRKLTRYNKEFKLRAVKLCLESDKNAAEIARDLGVHQATLSTWEQHYWGLWEAGGIFALTLFSVTTKNAAGYTLANHAIQLFPILIIGTTSTIMISVKISAISYKKYDG